MTDYYKRTNCRACKSTNVKLALNLAATPVGDHYLKENDLGKVQQSYPMDLYFCNDCTLAQLLDVVSPEILYANFIYETSISLGLKEHFQNYAQEVTTNTKLPVNSLVMDIGSNDGTLLSHFRDLGFNILGIDPAKEIAERATAKGIKTLATVFNAKAAEKILQQHGQASLICSNNTMANIDDLDDYLSGIKTLLNKEAYFVFETGYLSDILNNYLFDTIYHEHISYFSAISLQKLFNRHQLELVDLKKIPTKGGSIRGYVRHLGQGKVRDSVKSIIDQELAQEINTLKPYKKLASKISNTKNQLLDLLSSLAQDGKTIWGYGASVGVTTFLYDFNLNTYLNILVDDNPAKFNTYSPGHQLPVKSSAEIYLGKPDYIVILAWRYADPIIKKHRQYLKDGGKFIISWPEIKVIEK